MMPMTSKMAASAKMTMTTMYVTFPAELEEEKEEEEEEEEGEEHCERFHD